MPKLLIFVGIILIAVGRAWLAGERLGFRRLRGDFVIERGNAHIYIPMMTSLIIGIILSLHFWLIAR